MEDTKYFRDDELEKMDVRNSGETKVSRSLKKGFSGVFVCIAAFALVGCLGTLSLAYLHKTHKSHKSIIVNDRYRIPDFVKHLRTNKPSLSPTIETQTPTNNPTASPTQNPTQKPTQNAVLRRLGTVRTAAEKTLSMLEDYYGDTNVLQNTAYLTEGTQEYHNSMEYTAKKMARSIVHEDKFIIGAIGSSVVAGHDNCNYDSYENQLERLLKPVFEKANVDFVVRNAGQGGGCGDSMRNQIWCVRHMIGDDVDVVHYSWTYFEAGSSDFVKIHEQLIRWALLMPKSPPVHIFNVGEKFTKQACLQAYGPESMMTKYSQYGANVLCLQTGLTMSGKWGGKKWGEVGDGLHNHTRYDFKDGVVFRNWHPGNLGFQVVSDAFGYTYLKALLRALKIIENHKEDLHSTFPKIPSLVTKLPQPSVCDKNICDILPGCHNFEKPTYGKAQIHTISENDSFNPYKDLYHANNTVWKYYVAPPSRLIPREEINLSECQHFDRCGTILPTSVNSFTTFVLPRMTKGLVIVCCGIGKQCREEVLSKFDYYFDGKKCNETNFKPYLNGKCLMVQDKFHESLSDPTGHIYLGIRARELPKQKNFGISHIITL